MDAKNCRLFDDTVVENIMVSTGIAVLDYIRRHQKANEDDVCDFVERHTESIITEALEDMAEAERDFDDPDDAAPWKEQ